MNSESNKEYSVNWKNHMNHIRKAFDHLFNSNELTDVTLCCEGRKIGAHKILLSACSNYFRDTFKEVPSKHPVVILYGVEFNILLDILHFVYNGEVSVDISKLDDFLKVAQTLQISGLTDKHDGVDTTKIPKEENNPETANSSQDSDETFVEAASPVTHEEVRRPVKRARREATPVTESIQKAEEDSQLISDVKCEPPEILNFENPLTDPLQEDQIQDPHEFFANAAGHNSTVGEFKIEVEDHRNLERFADKIKPPKKLVPLNTLKTRACIWTAFKNFCDARDYSLNRDTTVEEISEILSDWGFNMKKMDGTDYKEGVVKTIWNTTAKILQEMFYDKYQIKFDPFRDIDFKKARDSRDSKRKQLKLFPEKRKICSITLNQLERLQIYSICDENTPSGLQRKFYHIAAFELSWKGRDAVNCLTRYFREEFDHMGCFTGRMKYSPVREGPVETKWLTANTINPDVCPVRLLLKLLDKRRKNVNIKTERLFLTPNPNWNKTETSAWYKDCPVGKNQIYTWIKEAAERIGIDTKKTKVTMRSVCPSTSKLF